MNLSNASFNLLQSLYVKYGTFIAATVAYVSDVLKIEIEEFNVSDLPEEWVQCLKKEARERHLLKREEPEKFSMFGLIGDSVG